MSTSEERAEWAKLADAATEGPWEWADGQGRRRLLGADGSREVLRCAALLEPAGRDAFLIAAARTAVPALLADVERLTAERDKARRAAQTLGKIVDDQCLDIARITRSEHLVPEDGDADWGAIWDRGFGLAAERDALGARIEKVRALHHRSPICDLVDDCPDQTDTHADTHHFESDDGEWVCDASPIGWTCAECAEGVEEPPDWPCPTISILDGDES